MAHNRNFDKVIVHVDFVHDSEKAHIVQIGSRKIAIPKSQARLRMLVGEKTIYELRIPRWLANKEQIPTIEES